jgi:hypothetical protein
VTEGTTTPIPEANRPPAWAALAGLAAISFVCFWPVEPTNFSGFDEWLDIDLASRGILSMPYQNRPLSLLFFLPGAFPASLGLAGYWWAQWLYLAATGALTFLLARRLHGASDGLAFLAGVIACVWAPSDRLRLDVVLGRGYAGATAASLFVLLLLAESYRARRHLGLALACVLAAVFGLAAEAVLPLLLLGTLLPWLVVGHAASRRLWAAAFGGCVALTGLWVALALRPGAVPSYQASALSFDPQPLRVAGRLLRLAGDHLSPLVFGDRSELLSPWCGGATAVLLLVWALLWRASRWRWEQEPRTALRLAFVGTMAAVAGYAAFSLSAAVRTPDRTQFLAVPGLGLLLASLASGVSAALPRPARSWLLLAFTAWIVASGAGRTVALQRDWASASVWPAQNASLVALTDLVPMTRPGTLLVLFDERGAWPANFTFRHAIGHLYEGRAKGFVPGAHDYFLYPGAFADDGFHDTPWPVIRKPWAAPVSHHRYSEMIVLRLRADGELTILDEWPGSVLPRPPAGADYEPRRLIVRDGPLPASRAILRRRP